MRRNWAYGLFAGFLAIGSTLVAAPPKKYPAKQAEKPSPRAASAAPAKSEPTPIPPVFYEFKGAKLGTTIDEWRAMTPPTDPPREVPGYKARFSAVQPFCTGDNVGKMYLGLTLSDDEQADGVIICNYRFIAYMYGGQTLLPAGFSIGKALAGSVRYKFFHSRLYEIEINGPANMLPEVLDGLMAKYGPSTMTINDTTQNRLGATFPHIVKVWTNPVATIHVESPFTRIDDTYVAMSLNAEKEALAASARARNPAANKM